MRPTTDGSGYVTAWEGGDADDAEFAALPPHGIPDPTGTGWRVTGSSPARVLSSPQGQKYAAEVSSPEAPDSASSPDIPDPVGHDEGDVLQLDEDLAPVWAPGGGGGGGSQPGWDYIQPDDPGAVGAGKTWLQTSTIGVAEWQPETAYEPGDPPVQPTAGNGHTYEAEGSFTSGASEPEWQTDGSPTPDGDGQWSDAGLAPSGAQAWVRDATDSQWGSISLVLDSSGRIRGRIWLNEDDGQLLIEYLSGTGSAGTYVSAIRLGSQAKLHGTDAVDVDLVGGGHATLYTGPTGDRGTALSLHSGGVDGAEAQLNLAYGAVDPSDGSGLAMPPGSLYSRTVGDGAGPSELWFKTGSGDTDWTNLTP